jgi:protocatechuate 3,4-dioxygenase beta subunit
MITTIGEIVRGDATVFPPYLYEAYRSTMRRAPRLPMVEVPLTASELTRPRLDVSRVTAEDADLTRNAGTGREALGQRIIVTGRVMDEDGLPVPGALLEVWQANAAGRYIHKRDDWPGPLDPNFLGIGRCLTNAAGEYRFLTVRPGAYPWGNHENAWRPAHIHFSDDPLLALDPILSAVPEGARSRLVAAYAHDITEPHWALGWRWDIVLAGPRATAFEAREQSAA